MALAKTVEKSFDNERERERRSNDKRDGRGEREALAGYERF